MLYSKSGLEKLVKLQEEKQKQFKRSKKLITSNILNKWGDKQASGKKKVKSASISGKDSEMKEESSAATRDLILTNLNERMGNMVDALFAFWSNKK